VSDDVRVAPLRGASPDFTSGRDELDRSFAHHAPEATPAGSARVYVAHRRERLVGYFALCAGSVDPERAGTRTRKGMPRHPIPVVLLARLAVASDTQGGGIGHLLVRRAGELTVRAARLIAVRALIVDALDAETAAFYERVGFTPMQAEALRLEILVKDLEPMIGRSIDD
jgi:GNAT superfamily N-acetyltransferase